MKTLNCDPQDYPTVVIPLSDIYSIVDSEEMYNFHNTLYNSLEAKGMRNPLLIAKAEVFRDTDLHKFESREIDKDFSEPYYCLIGNNRYRFAKLNGYTHIECCFIDTLEQAERLHKETLIKPRKM